jgi:hypothetical protein
MVDTFRLFPKVKQDDDVDAMTQALLKLDDLMRKGTRVNLSINGRHADNRTARVTARGEMVIAI